VESSAGDIGVHSDLPADIDAAIDDILNSAELPVEARVEPGNATVPDAVVELPAPAEEEAVALHLDSLDDDSADINSMVDELLETL